jgi:alpha-D-ribose 1-methylphosphonate 5-triphosphate diphosphatase PhnM
LLELLHEAIRERSALVPLVIAALTANPAAALALPDRGRLQPGARADLLLLEPDSGILSAVMCGGRWLAGPEVADPGLVSC